MEYEGEALSKYNAIQNAIQLLCVGKRKCWKKDPATCPIAQINRARGVCDVHESPPPADAPEDDEKLRCFDSINIPVKWCMTKCSRNTRCPEFRAYIRMIADKRTA